MYLKEDLEINKYAQNLLGEVSLINEFSTFDITAKRSYLNHLTNLILQSKPNVDDIEIAIKESKLKNTYTPCVLLKKGLKYVDFKKIIDLPENELNKALILFLNLFKIAYQRRFQEEKNVPNKWWYWDLSDKKNVDKIKTMLGRNSI
jgi:hypothetical protein